MIEEITLEDRNGKVVAVPTDTATRLMQSLFDRGITPAEYEAFFSEEYAKAESRLAVRRVYAEIHD